MSTVTITSKDKWLWTSVLLVPSLTAMIISIINYTETSKLDNACDSKIKTAKDSSLGMMILSLLLFVCLFFILKINNLFPLELF